VLDHPCFDWRDVHHLPTLPSDRRGCLETLTAGFTAGRHMNLHLVGFIDQVQGVPDMSWLAAWLAARLGPLALGMGLDSRRIGRGRLGTVATIGAKPGSQRRVVGLRVAFSCLSAAFSASGAATRLDNVSTCATSSATSLTTSPTTASGPCWYAASTPSRRLSVSTPHVADTTSVCQLAGLASPDPTW